LALQESIGYVSKGIQESNMDFIPEFIFSEDDIKKDEEPR